MLGAGVETGGVTRWDAITEMRRLFAMSIVADEAEQEVTISVGFSFSFLIKYYVVFILKS